MVCVEVGMTGFTVTLDNKRVDEILLIVHDLKHQGLRQGADFDFAYYQPRWDNMTGDVPGYVEFKFYDNKWASWFNLKWS
jgi:hypothetical protein